MSLIALVPEYLAWHYSAGIRSIVAGAGRISATLVHVFSISDAPLVVRVTVRFLAVVSRFSVGIVAALVLALWIAWPAVTVGLVWCGVILLWP